MKNLCETCPSHPSPNNSLADCHAKITEVTFYSDVRPGKKPNDCSAVSSRGTTADAVVECAEYMRLTADDRTIDNPTRRSAA